MTSDSQIDYESLAQKAMRGVVRSVLERTAELGGLPGDHHFYISFDTQMPGITLSKRLRERYPQEMTIVLQHRFWDLKVTPNHFEVKLTFDSIPELLVIPFEAIKVFFDPSVRYGLQFEEPETNGQTLEQAMASMEDDVRDQTIAPEPTPLMHAKRRSTDTESQDADGKRDEPDSGDTLVIEGTPEKLPEAQKAFEKTSNGAEEETVAADDGEEASSSGAEIVSLDAFRKK